MVTCYAQAAIITGAATNATTLNGATFAAPGAIGGGTASAITGTAIVGTTFNGNTLTTGSSTYTGTAGQTYTFPTTSATIARTDASNVFTGAASFSTTLAAGGTTLNGSPAAKFQVNGSSGAFYVRDNGTEAYFTAASDNYFGCNVSSCKLNLLSGVGSTAITISGTGAVAMPGLASSSAATTGTLCWTTVTGNVNVDTTTTCLLSARKFKKDIFDLGGALDEVMALRPVSYQLRDEVNPEHLGRQVGFIADEVQKIDPRFVSTEADGQAHGVRYQQMTALLAGAIQEQQRRIVLLQWIIGLMLLAAGARCYWNGRP